MVVRCGSKCSGAQLQEGERRLQLKLQLQRLHRAQARSAEHILGDDVSREEQLRWGKRRVANKLSCYLQTEGLS